MYKLSHLTCEMCIPHYPNFSASAKKLIKLFVVSCNYCINLKFLAVIGNAIIKSSR